MPEQGQGPKEVFFIGDTIYFGSREDIKTPAEQFAAASRGVCVYGFLEKVGGLGVHLHTFEGLRTDDGRAVSISFFHAGLLRHASRYDNLFSVSEAQSCVREKRDAYAGPYASINDILDIAIRTPNKADGKVFIDPIELLTGRADYKTDKMIWGNLIDNMKHPAFKEVAAASTKMPLHNRWIASCTSDWMEPNGVKNAIFPYADITWHDYTRENPSRSLIVLSRVKMTYDK